MSESNTEKPKRARKPKISAEMAQAISNVVQNIGPVKAPVEEKPKRKYTKKTKVEPQAQLPLEEKFTVTTIPYKPSIPITDHTFIFLNGPPKVGKDTFAAQLDPSKFLVTSFAYNVKLFAHNFHGDTDGSMISVFETIKDKPQDLFNGLTPREAYILYGEGLKSIFGPYIWAARTLDQIVQANPNGKTIIITDLGFSTELDFFVKKFAQEKLYVLHLLRAKVYKFGENKFVSMRNQDVRRLLRYGHNKDNEDSRNFVFNAFANHKVLYLDDKTKDDETSKADLIRLAKAFSRDWKDIYNKCATLDKFETFWGKNPYNITKIFTPYPQEDLKLIAQQMYDPNVFGQYTKVVK